MNQACPPFLSDHASSYSSSDPVNDNRENALASLLPREVVTFLISTFFRFAQATFFYIHPEIFSRKLSAFTLGLKNFLLVKIRRRRAYPSSYAYSSWF